jgi:hypothetical protein
MDSENRSWEVVKECQNIYSKYKDKTDILMKKIVMNLSTDISHLLNENLKESFEKVILEKEN